jgi:transposase
MISDIMKYAAALPTDEATEGAIQRDADHFRDRIAEAGGLAVIPNNPSRSTKLPFDKELYKERHLVECCFSKLKQFRRVANPIRGNRAKLPRHCNHRSYNSMDQMSVHTT